MSTLSEEFLEKTEALFGPFDRPFQFQVFPFDSGGRMNFMTSGADAEAFVTCMSWQLLEHPQLKPSKALGRYELLAECDDRQWCFDMLTNIGRLSLNYVFEPGDTIDISPWTSPSDVIQGFVFEEVFREQLWDGKQMVPCGVLKCLGVTRNELKLATERGVAYLIEELKTAGVYPRTTNKRASVL